MAESKRVTRAKLGINAKRDWGGKINGAMWLMLQQEKPEDFVIGTETALVEDFLKVAFEHVGLNFKDYLKIDEKFLDQLR